MACFWKDNLLTTEDCGGGGGGEWRSIGDYLDTGEVFLNGDPFWGFSVDDEGFVILDRPAEANRPSSIAIDASVEFFSDMRITVLEYNEAVTTPGTFFEAAYINLYWTDDVSNYAFNTVPFPADAFIPSELTLSDFEPDTQDSPYMRCEISSTYQTGFYTATAKFLVEVKPR